MQNEQTLIELGFKHYPEWDAKTTNTKYYRLDYKGLVFMAHVWDEKHGFPRDKQFVSLGLVVSNNRFVDRFRDCCSNGSVKRKIENIWNEKQL